MAFSNNFDTATPPGGGDPAEADDRMREIKAAVQERLAVEHVFDLTGTEVSGANTGKHTDITTLSIVNAGALVNVGNLIINTDKFTIDAATGNVVVAGTLNVTGPASFGNVLNGTVLSSSAAPGADETIPCKKYVDDTVAAEAFSPDPMTGGNDSNGTVTFPNGMIWKWGKVTRGANPTTVTFGTAFPNACFQAFVCGGQHMQGYDAQSHTITAASFKIYCSVTTGNPIRWFAVGR